MKRIFLVIMLILCNFAFAEEGMWLMTQIDQLNLKEKGLQIDVEDIYHPDKPSISDALITFGFCTASFVSPDGLILTNHHCSRGSLQRASEEGRDYLTDGFLARNRSEEIEAKGVTARVLQEMRDVTEEILQTVSGIDDPVERQKKIDQKTREMSEAIEAGRKDVQAGIVPMYNGMQYILFVYKKYPDVRIVFAPPDAIGNFGGETDNWMWPRHTGDFTFMRAYMAPDGTGAKYSPDNVPVKPKYYLPIAKSDLKIGDFTFIMGFPGGTNRWRTSNSVAWNLKYNYPDQIQNSRELIDLLDRYSEGSEEGRIRVAARKGRLYNGMKNAQGMVDGMKRTGFLDKKIAFEKELMAFIDNDTKLKETYGDVLDRIRAEYATLEETRLQDDVLGLFQFSCGVLPIMGIRIVDTVYERAKPEDARDPGYSEKEIQQAVERIHLNYYDYYEPADKAMLKRVLLKANDLPEKSRILGLEPFLKNGLSGIESFVEKAYQKTKLKDAKYVKSLYSKTIEELKAVDDPLVQMALSFRKDREEFVERNRLFFTKVDNLRKKYINALYAWKGEGLYPDANGTLRFCYGNVTGYSPADAVRYTPFTTLTGVIGKDTGEDPFDVPEKLKELYRNKDFGRWVDPELNDVPVCFLHRGDTTGGSSGSPVFNAKGELIGLAFDGNYEAMTSDWQHDYNMQRDISVDIRYVLFIAEKFAGADYILKELGL